ncbi:MAG: PAS domain S-box protein [Burkholderiales bacterium]|nr:PAS domain S-box protein [Burkholderiales bacterium]
MRHWLPRFWQGPHSVRMWLIGQFLLVVLVATVAVSTLVAFWWLPLVRVQAEAEQDRVADMAKYQVEINLDLAQRQAAALAGIIAMGPERPGVPEALFASLRALRDDGDSATTEFFQGVYWLDARYRLKDMAVRMPLGIVVEHWLGNDFSGLDVVRTFSATRQLAWSDRYTSPVLGIPVVSMAMPAGDGVLLVELSVEQMTQSVTDGVALEGLHVLVTDSRAELIAAPDMNLAHVRTNLSHWPVIAQGLAGQAIHADIDIDGKRFTGTTRRLPRLGWLVYAGYPTSVTERSRHAALGITLATLLLAVGVGLALFTTFSNVVKRRMERSATYARTVANGQYGTPGLTTGIAELDRLDAELGHMARTIERRERQLRSIVETTPSLAIQWFDTEGRVVDWNPASEAMLGWTKAEAMGKPLEQLIYTPEQQAGFMAVLADIARTGQPFGPYEGDVRCRTGELRTILSTTFGVPDVAGGLQFVCMDVDITDLKRKEAAIRASEHKFNLFFQASPVAVAVLARVDGGFVHVDVNQSWEQLLNLTRAQAVTEQFRLSDLLANKAINANFLNEMVPGGVVNLEPSWLVRKDGSRFLAEGAAARLVMDGRDMVIYSLHDVTEPWRMREELQTLNAELENRIAQRTEKLTQANQELGDAFRRLQDAQDRLVQSDKLASLGALVAGVAHEMNTPIGNGLMAVSTLAQRTREVQAMLDTGLRRSDFERFLTQVETAADISTRNLGRASELIASFKRVAVDQTSSQRCQFDLAEVVHEIVLTLQPTLKHTPYQVVTEVPSGLVLDSFPGPLGQVVANLVQNAVVHAFGGRSDGRIHVSAQADGDQVVLTVADDGKGIPTEHLAKVFDPFFTTRLGQGGSGLGLHIVHNVVTGLLGGQIEVHSVVGQGTAIVIRCPCVAPQRAAADASAA